MLYDIAGFAGSPSPNDKGIYKSHLPKVMGDFLVIHQGIPQFTLRFSPKHSPDLHPIWWRLRKISPGDFLFFPSYFNIWFVQFIQKTNLLHENVLSTWVALRLCFIFYFGKNFKSNYHFLFSPKAMKFFGYWYQMLCILKHRLS